MNYVMLAATVAENATKRTNWNIYSWLLERYDIANTQTSLVLMLAGVILCMVIPYLLGSINFAIIISKKQYSQDIRAYGSNNAGMTNMMRTYGTRAAGLTLLGDALKAVVAALVGYAVIGQLGPQTFNLVNVIIYFIRNAILSKIK